MTPNPRDEGKQPGETSPLLRCAQDIVKDFPTDLPQDIPRLKAGHEQSCEPDVYLLKTPQLGVFASRWWVLFLFSMLAFAQSLVWITWSSISISAKDVFGWTDTSIALLVDWGNVPFILLVVPISWLLDVKGLRVSTLLSALLVVLGTGLRCITARSLYATPFIHVGQLLNGIAGIVFTGAPPQLSAAWFPPHQRTTATSIAVLVNYLGIACGYMVGPVFVPHNPMPTCNNISFHSHEIGLCDNATLSRDYINDERLQIMKLMYYEFGLAAVLFLATLVYFPDKPPLPPSATATQEKERLQFMATLVKLLRNRNFWIVGLGYAVTGVVANFLSVLGPALEPFGITQSQTGVMGMTSTLAGCLSSLIVARFVDCLGGRMKLCLILMWALGCANFVWYTLLYVEVFTPTLERLYPAVIVTGIVAYTGSALYMELCVEVAYPVQEGMVGIVLQTIMNLFGTIFLGLFLIPNIGVSWMNWCLIGSAVIGVVLAILQTEKYHRSDLDRAAHKSEYQPINCDVEDIDPCPALSATSVYPHLVDV